MANILRHVTAAAIAVLTAGCGTAAPDAGLTNGTSPSVLRDNEKPSVRDDFRAPEAKGGEAAIAESAASSPGGPGTNAGTGGAGGGQVGKSSPDADSSGSKSEPKGAPPVKQSTGENGAQGGTKPPGDVKTGTPRSPQ